MLSFIAAHNADIIAVILLLVVGPAIGNYACSVVYRLPRGQTPFEKHPFCGHCGTMLQPIDLFPVLSFLLTRGRCRYCKGPIPAVYTVIEIACAALMIAYYFAFGVGDVFLLYSAAGVFVVTMAAIGYGHGFVSSFLYCITVLLLLLAHVVQGGALMGALQPYVMLLVAGLGLHALAAKCRRIEPNIAQASAAWWFALTALILPISEWRYGAAVLLGLVILAVGVSKRFAVHVGIPCMIVTMIAAMNLL